MSPIHQQNLFAFAGPPPPRRYDLPDADVTLYDGFFAPDEANRLFATLLADTPWQQEAMQFYGKPVAVPRLTAWYGDRDRPYTWSGITMTPLPWTADLAVMKARVEAAAGVTFTSVLLNRYRTGRDSVAWHSDDEPELGREPVIASVSLGATRPFQLRHRERADLPRVDIPLTHGSLLVMAGPTQHCWKHQIPKTARPIGERVNLTFRVIH